MADITVSPNRFNPNPWWEVPLDTKCTIEQLHPFVMIDLFDQNGYDLCPIEKMYSDFNKTQYDYHRSHRTAIKQDWLQQKYKNEGAVINHALLFERKGYAGRALNQLKEYANYYPMYYKLINIKPKWGLDFSIDYFDREGNTFEVVHWEYDGFDFNEVSGKKQEVEQQVVAIDWDKAAREILQRKDEWYHLDFQSQSNYKCDFFNICHERYKMVAWV